MLITLKRAVGGHRSTSRNRLRLLMEACIHVPTTKMRVNGHFRHHTFLFPSRKVIVLAGRHDCLRTCLTDDTLEHFSFYHVYDLLHPLKVNCTSISKLPRENSNLRAGPMQATRGELHQPRRSPKRVGKKRRDSNTRLGNSWSTWRPPH